jgi:outer membrane protein OmpA-like peptidoglycan-associated protein
MLSPIDSMCRQLAIAAVVSFLALPCAFAQQGTGPALPPPSLYDDVTPHPATTSPAPVPVGPVGPAHEPTSTPQPTAAPQPAAAPPPVAAPVVKPEPAAVPVERSQPAAAPVEHAPASVASQPLEEQAVEEPWYRRLWPFGRSKTEPAPAPALAQAPAPAVTAPPGRTGAQGERSTFAYDRPSKVIRTTVVGDCVKTGFWDTTRWGTGSCPGAAPTEPVAVAPPAPAPRVIEPEPVQVQPLKPEPVEEPRALTPEPQPVAAPPPPPPVKTTTLSADTLFALNSFQLRPTAKAKLDEFAAELDQFDYSRIHITGHTDPTGGAQLNERLSRQRAEAVKRYLVTKGLPASKIVAEGVGSSMPMVTDKDCSKLPRGQMVACFQPDRRVDIQVSGVTMAHK